MTYKELENKYNEFKNKYNGKYTDFDGAYGAQCWDLAQRYFIEVLNVPEYVLSGCGNVKEMLWGNERAELDQYFDEVPTTAMRQGDVCIWEANHIAIFDNYNVNDNNCYYFSQNPNPCQVMPVNMQGHHAFRRKGIVDEEQSKEEPKEETPVTTNDLKIGDYVKIVAEGNGSSYGDSNVAVPGYEGTITDIYDGRPFPYEVSDHEGVLGYYPASSLQK